MAKGVIDADGILNRAKPLVHHQAHEIQPYGHLLKLPIVLAENVCKEGVDNLNQPACRYDHAYRDVRYVEELVGPETVNRMPLTTLDAVRDHGVIRPSLEEDVEGAHRTREESDRRLQAIRHDSRERSPAATCIGFGPRFLHSTGQAYKGGPNTGVFLQITCDDASDVPVPGRKHTFGTVKAAQAQGDVAVLAARGRRALRVHVGRDIAAGLDALIRALNGSPAS